MKIRYYIIIFILMLFLIGCDKKIDDKNQKPDDVNNNERERINDLKVPNNVFCGQNISLYVGEEFNPFLVYGRENYDYEPDNDLISVDSLGNVKALKEGTSKLRLFEGNHFAGTIFINIKNAPIIDLNCDNNDYDSLKSSIDNINNDKFSLILEKNINDKKETTTIKRKKDNFYLEKEFDNNLEKSVEVYKKFYNKYFKILIENDQKKEAKELSNDDLVEIKELDFNYFSYLKNFDSGKIELNKIDDFNFNLKYKYSDYKNISELLNNETKELLEKVPDTIIEADISFDDFNLIINNKFVIHDISGSYNYKNELINIKFEYNFNDFQEYDLSSYNKYGAFKIEEAYYDENVNNYCSSNNNFYICKYFEKGQYSLIGDKIIVFQPVILYDENYNLIESFTWKDAGNYIRALNGLINIEKDGLYYLYISMSSDSEFSIKKLNYRIDDPEELKSSQGFIYGKYYYKEFTYERTDENDLIKITNLSTYPLYFTSLDVLNENTSDYVELRKGKSALVMPKKDKISIYITSSNASYTSLAEAGYIQYYDFEVEIINNPNGRKDYLELTDEYQQIIIGFGVESPLIELNVPEDGIYCFIIKRNSLETIMTVEEEETKERGQYFYLKAGKYKFKCLWQNSGESYVRYKKFPIEKDIKNVIVKIN